MLNSILVILCLIAVSAFFSISEISLAASRKIKLKLLADEGNVNAQRVLKMQENPGTFFTVVQIGLNAVAILGGIVGDAAFSPAFHSLLSGYLSPELSEQLSFIISFTLVTSLFILFADLTPKRIGMIAPETVALRIINPMRFCLLVFRPLVWLFNGMANMIFRIFKLPMVRKDDITSDDIYAVVEAGALAGVLRSLNISSALSESRLTDAASSAAGESESEASPTLSVPPLLPQQTEGKLPDASAADAARVQVQFGADNATGFVYDADSGTYKMLHADGTPQLDANNRQQAGFDNLLILFSASSLRDDGLTLDYDLSMGGGVWLNGGHLWTLTWTQGSDSTFAFYDADGRPFNLLAGRSYLALVSSLTGQELTVTNSAGEALTSASAP